MKRSLAWNRTWGLYSEILSMLIERPINYSMYTLNILYRTKPSHSTHPINAISAITMRADKTLSVNAGYK